MSLRGTMDVSHEFTSNVEAVPDLQRSRDQRWQNLPVVPRHRRDQTHSPGRERGAQVKSFSIAETIDFCQTTTWNINPSSSSTLARSTRSLLPGVSVN